jgi:SAM-dependent MidA family methyltransferase
VWELGAGRGEMQPYLEEFGYTAIDVGRGALPEKMRGVVFANEFFDALPVERCVWRRGSWRMRDVTWTGERFAWREGDRAGAEVAEYLARFGPENPEDGTVSEAAPTALVWMDELARRLEGDAVIIDYGYTRRELLRFPAGTLMSYRRHQAEDDVLATPGERDITAHVNFTALRERARERGMTELRFESMGRMLLDAGEQDQFAAALQAETETECTRRRLQLKSLLFGMGESFRALVLRRRM